MTVDQRIPRGQTMSSEELRQVSDAVIRGLEESAKEWNNWFSLNNARFAEQYVKGVFEILVRLVDSDGRDFCCLFRIADRLNNHCLRGGPGGFPDCGSSAERVGNSHSNVLLSADRYQQSVLVNNVQVVKHPEKMVFSSFVRFEQTERVANILAGSLYLHLNQGADVVFIPFPWLPKDRESSILAPIRFWNELPHQVVERATEIVDSIPDGERKTYLVSSEPVSYLPSLWIGIGDRYVRVIVSDEDRNKGVNVSDVLMGPVNLAGDPRSYRASRHDRLPFVRDSR